MEKNDWVFIGIILALVVLLCAIFIFAKTRADSGLIKYTSKEGDVFKFSKQMIGNTTFYRIYIFENYDYVFRHSPFDVENIPVEKDIVTLFNRPKGTELIYITQDEDFLNKTGNDDVIGIGEFSRIIGTNDYGVFKIPTKSVITNRVSGKDNPAISCANVSDTIAVIYVKEGEDKVYSQNGCIIIQSTVSDIVKVGTRFAYYLANIIPA